MGKLLIVGNPSKERDSLALVLEFAGHECATAGTLEEAGAYARRGKYQLVLADSPLEGRSPEETVQALRAVAPKAPVMFLTEEVEPRSKSDEVVSGPQPAGDNTGVPPFSLVSLGEALAVLLPKPEAFSQMEELPRTPGVLNRLASLYQAQKEYDAAEQLYKQALEISENVRKHPGEVATLLNNLASLYHEQQKYSQAEPLYRKSLEIVEKTFGPKHPKATRRLRSLADLYQATGKSEMAGPILERLKGVA
jgi:DNA-binding response OmpR family regulator